MLSTFNTAVFLQGKKEVGKLENWSRFLEVFKEKKPGSAEPSLAHAKDKCLPLWG